MARPRKPVDPKKVFEMARVGCTSEEIAGCLGVSKSTIDHRFCKPLKEGGNWLRHTLKRKLFQMALNGNVPAMIFAAKVYCGLKEPRDDAVTVNVSANATAVVKSPQEIKAHLLELQKAVREEAKRLELN